MKLAFLLKGKGQVVKREKSHVAFFVCPLLGLVFVLFVKMEPHFTDVSQTLNCSIHRVLKIVSLKNILGYMTNIKVPVLFCGIFFDGL